MTETTGTSPIRCSVQRSGEIQRILLDRPKANVLDIEMISAIRERLRAAFPRFAIQGEEYGVEGPGDGVAGGGVAEVVG